MSETIDALGLEKKLLGLVHGEFSSLTITWNDHACNYLNVEKAISDGLYDHTDFVSDEERLKAIATNSVWTVHWYPETPVGFCSISASTLAAAIEAAMRPE